MIFNLYDEDETRLVQEIFAGKIVGFTSGSFDTYHIKHEAYLNSCRRFCGHDGVLIVGVDSDDLVRRRKGEGRPIVDELSRMQLIAGWKGVAAAFILGTVEDFGRAVSLLNVKYIFKNEEGSQVKVWGSDLPGVELVIVPDTQSADSTTAIIEKIRKSSKPRRSRK